MIASQMSKLLHGAGLAAFMNWHHMTMTAPLKDVRDTKSWS